MRRAVDHRGMDDLTLGRLIRALRQRRGWRQADLALRAGMGRTVVSDVESGRIDRTCLATIWQIAAAVGLSVDVGARGLGADIDRVLDVRHAMLLGTAARWLTDLGWKCVAEVSYSEFGERGSVDLLAWHQPSSSLLVIEVKTELASVEATLRKHDEKVRLAARIAAERFHWSAVSVSGLLVLPDDRREHVASTPMRRCSKVPTRSARTAPEGGVDRRPVGSAACCSFPT